MKPALPATLLKLAAVAVLFYASYGLTNYLTALRAPVPEIIYGWERAMPFVPWTIIPYWSLNLLYALGFFLARTRAELHRYIAQLLAAQAIAVCGFLLFPLQISWAKPDGDGIFFALFRSLAAFDQAYNEAPSLHIILTLIVGRNCRARCARSGSAGACSSAALSSPPGSTISLTSRPRWLPVPASCGRYLGRAKARCVAARRRPRANAAPS